MSFLSPLLHLVSSPASVQAVACELPPAPSPSALGWHNHLSSHVPICPQMLPSPPSWSLGSGFASSPLSTASEQEGPYRGEWGHALALGINPSPFAHCPHPAAGIPFSFDIKSLGNLPYPSKAPASQNLSFSMPGWGAYPEGNTPFSPSVLPGHHLRLVPGGDLPRGPHIQQTGSGAGCQWEWDATQRRKTLRYPRPALRASGFPALERCGCVWTLWGVPDRDIGLDLHGGSSRNAGDSMALGLVSRGTTCLFHLGSVLVPHAV